MGNDGRRSLLGVQAVVGVVLGHIVVYALVHPDPANRADSLAASGHVYWPVAVALAAVGALLAVAGVLLAAAGRGLSGANTRHSGVGIAGWLGRLAALQLALYGGMEIVERAAAGADLSALVGAPELRLGLVVQLVVALAMVAMLSLLDLVTERMAASFGASVPCFPRAGHQLQPGGREHRAAIVSIVRPRAPPRLAVAQQP